MALETANLPDEQEAQFIRLRARQIRGRMVHTADDLKETTQTLLDWRYHVGNHALLSVGAAVLAGYLVVPSRATPVSTPELIEPSASESEVDDAPSVLADARSKVMSVVADLALKTVIGFLGYQLQKVFSNAGAPSAQDVENESAAE